MIHFRDGIHFLSCLRNDDIEPDETQRIALSLLSIDFWGVNFGIRAFRVYTPDYDIDDFFDRALLGININHGRLIVEILFTRLIIG